MSTKTATISIRIEPEVKAEAEKIYNKIGISTSDAVNMFLRQTIIHKGLPFAVRTKKPKYPPHLDATHWSKERMEKELEKGFKAVERGDTMPAEEAFAIIEEKYFSGKV